MEGRMPARLHVELVRSPDTVLGRAAAVAAAGWRVSTWEPCQQLIEFERRLPACDGVVIGEGDGGVVARASEATTVVPLSRYPRPSQGVCSGERTTGMLLVLISPRAESGAQALRDWGDFVHLRHIAAAATPGYRTITAWENESSGEPRFCHLYEMVSDDPQATFELMTPLVKRQLSPEDFKAWSWHSELIIDESRTYRRIDPGPSEDLPLARA